jgi:hypothetical protein
LGLKIRALATTAGYMEGSRVEFSDGLTCIIGARGTCKSTVVETIRFAFACDKKRVDALLGKNAGDSPDVPAVFGLVKTTLAGGTARCELVEGPPDSPLVVERHVDAEAPTVARDKVKELSGPPVLDRIEIYSQGDLQRIAEDGGRRLELIDRPHRTKIDGLLEKRRDATRTLRELGLKLRSTRASIEARRADLAALQGLSEQLRALTAQRPELSPALDTERQGYLQRKARLERAEALTAKRQEMLGGLIAMTDREGDFRAAAADVRSVEAPGTQALAGLFLAFADLLGQARRTADAQRGIETEPLLAQIRAAFKDRDQAYQKLQLEQQEVQDSLKAEDKLRQEIGKLERLEGELKAHLQTEQDVVQSRTRRRQEITRLGDEIFALRQAEVSEINARFRDVIVLSLSQGTRTQEYRATLDRLLQGSRLRNQTEIARDLALKVPPFMLVDAIESGDSALLAAHLDRDKGQMAKLVGFLLDSPGLYDLESATFEDQLEITLFVDGVPKPVQQLSKGQMATALLPLVLRKADYPLIFDQPEDDLDNRYIYQTLVARIRELKATRQLIFVTHNANIPVLGDAERVVVMQMESPTKAGAPLVGTVDQVSDSILGLLEGGAEAFKLRQKRYGALVD